MYIFWHTIFEFYVGLTQFAIR